MTKDVRNRDANLAIVIENHHEDELLDEAKFLLVVPHEEEGEDPPSKLKVAPKKLSINQGPSFLPINLIVPVAVLPSQRDILRVLHDLLHRVRELDVLHVERVIAEIELHNVVYLDHQQDILDQSCLEEEDDRFE